MINFYRLFKEEIFFQVVHEKGINIFYIVAGKFECNLVMDYYCGFQLVKKLARELCKL